MATIFPGAIWKPMPGSATRPKRRKGRGVGYHIAVYEGSSIYNINLGTGNDAHLYVRRDGTCEQNIDLDLQAWAGADGNGSMIWVETQGGTTATDVKSGLWTGAQFETLAQIAAWANRTEGVPLQVMPDSRSTSRGLATHRLGIQHSLGVGAVPGWLISGGERWSKVIGKECPGDARVRQIPALVARAQQIVNGSPLEDDMPTPDDLFNAALFTVDGKVLRLRDVLNAIHQAATTANGVFNSDDYPGGPEDNAVGHTIAAHKYAKAAADALASGAGQAAPSAAVNVDAAAVAAALAGDASFVNAIAEASADKIAARLQS